MKKRNPNQQVTNINFYSSNRPFRSHKSNGNHENRNHRNGGKHYHSNSGNRHGNQRPSDRLAMISIIASAAVSIVKILKQKNDLYYLR